MEKKQKQNKIQKIFKSESIDNAFRSIDSVPMTF